MNWSSPVAAVCAMSDSSVAILPIVRVPSVRLARTMGGGDVRNLEPIMTTRARSSTIQHGVSFYVLAVDVRIFLLQLNISQRPFLSDARSEARTTFEDDIEHGPCGMGVDRDFLLGQRTCLLLPAGRVPRKFDVQTAC